VLGVVAGTGFGYVRPDGIAVTRSVRSLRTARGFYRNFYRTDRNKPGSANTA